MGRVSVYARIRPGADDCLAADGPTTVKMDGREGAQKRTWDFDGVLPPEAPQAAVYDDVGAPILDAVLQGYNGTVFAYGQTGAGKTHTLLNAGDGTGTASMGLVPRLAAALFVHIESDVRHVYRVKASFAQIYNEQIDDLLRPSSTNLKLKPTPTGGYAVDGLAEVQCKTAAQLLQAFDSGRRHLRYAETKLNKSSSRSHAVLQLSVSRRLRVLDANEARLTTGSMETRVCVGKLTVVDLAGSERVKRSGADQDLSGKQMREAININSSLLGLSNVMKALASGATHVPYRDSKLTHMLADSIGGNCRTTLVVAVSPAAADAGESAGSLEFGARAMKVRTHEKINEATVLLDAAALAADFQEALRLRAEGGVGGRLLELEAQLREANERGGDVARLQSEMEGERARQKSELEAALAQAAASDVARREEVSALEKKVSALASEEEATRRRLAAEATEREELEAALATQAARQAEAVKGAQDEAAAARGAAAAAKEAAAKAAADLAAAEAARDSERRAAADELAKLKADHAAECAAERRAHEEQVARLKGERDEVTQQLEEVEENAARRDATAAALEFRLANAAEEAEAREESRREAEEAAAAALASEQRLASSLEARVAEESARAAATAEAMEAERAAAAERLANLEAAHDAALATVEAAVGPLQHMVTKLMKQCADQGAAAAAALEAMQTKFSDLSTSYSDTVARLQVTEEEKTALQAKVDEVTAAMEAERQRQQEESSALNEELEAHQASLAQVMVESRAKSTLLSGAIDAGNAARAELEAAGAAAEAAAAELARVENELEAAEGRASELRREYESMEGLMEGELREAEEQRREEAGRLLAAAEAKQEELEEERARLSVVRQHSVEAAVAATAAEAAEAAAAAAERAEATEEELKAARRALWQRLKRQALLQSTAVRRLEEGLKHQQEQRAALEALAADHASLREMMTQRESELVGSQQAAAEAEAEHVQQLLCTGVIALKHGRKGKPHPRRVRVGRTGRRLEWGRAAGAAGADTDARADKGIDVETIVDILPGCVTDISRRGGRGREARFLCVIAGPRTLDLEFGSEAMRDTWLRVLRRWRELACPPATPLGPSRSHTMPVRPSPVATGSSTAGLSTVGAERSAPLEKTPSPTSPIALNALQALTAHAQNGRARITGSLSREGSRARIGFSSSASAPRMPTFSRASSSSLRSSSSGTLIV